MTTSHQDLGVRCLKNNQVKKEKWPKHKTRITKERKESSTTACESTVGQKGQMWCLSINYRLF